MSVLLSSVKIDGLNFQIMTVSVYSKAVNGVTIELAPDSMFPTFLTYKMKLHPVPVLE